MNRPYRMKNDRGGHDLTAEGWAKAAEIGADLAAKTKAVAEAAMFGRDSQRFKSAHQAWQSALQSALVFYTTGELPS